MFQNCEKYGLGSYKPIQSFNSFPFPATYYICSTLYTVIDILYLTTYILASEIFALKKQQQKNPLKRIDLQPTAYQTGSDTTRLWTSINIHDWHNIKKRNELNPWMVYTNVIFLQACHNYFLTAHNLEKCLKNVFFFHHTLIDVFQYASHSLATSPFSGGLIVTSTSGVSGFTSGPCNGVFIWLMTVSPVSADVYSSLPAGSGSCPAFKHWRTRWNRF